MWTGGRLLIVDEEMRIGGHLWQLMSDSQIVDKQMWMGGVDYGV